MKSEVLTWFRTQSFADWRNVLRSHCSFTLQLLSLAFTLLLPVRVVLRRRLAAGVFGRGDVQLHVQRNRADHGPLRLQGGGRGRRRQLTFGDDCCGRGWVLLLASAFPRRLLLLLKLLLLEAALLLAEFGPAVFEPNLR